VRHRPPRRYPPSMWARCGEETTRKSGLYRRLLSETFAVVVILAAGRLTRRASQDRQVRLPVRVPVPASRRPDAGYLNGGGPPGLPW
jgi:hypothetical protein